MAENKLQSMTEIFNEKFFRIPDYQRGYSWGEKQLEDFWEDIINLKDDRVHYTGLLTVEPIPRSSVENLEKWQDDMWFFDRELKAYYLIDGQQRLTTSIILLNEILGQYKDEEDINFKTKDHWRNKFLFQTYKNSYKSYIFGYEKDNPSDEFFKTKILNQESSTSDKVPEQTLYTSNLNFAKKFFNKKLEKLETNEIENIFKKITSKIKFNFYEIDDELDTYVTFETMNNRGKPLSTLELLKNRLIYLSTLLDIDSSLKARLRSDINETWKTIYEFLGKNKDNPLDDDDFLRNHWIMYYTYDRKESDSFAKFLLNKRFTAKNVLQKNLKFNDIKDYIDSLSKSIKSWFYLFNVQYSNYSDETKEWIQKLNRLGMSAFPPLFMAALTKCKEEEFLPLLKAAEKFIFLVFRLSQRPSNTKNSHFYRLANMFYFEKDYWGYGETDIEKVINDINWNTFGSDEEWGWFDLGKFRSYIQDQYKKGEGFYSWNGLRYFLYEYELNLQEKSRGNKKVKWSDFNRRKKEDTIEHIYPQTPTDDYWRNQFKNFNKKEKNILLHNLGNLVLLNQSKNSELQNKSFNFKKKHLNKEGDEVGFYNGSYSEIAISCYDNWGAEEIIKRGLELLTFMERRWNISFQEWELDKKDLLLLNFSIEKPEVLEL
ncbi:DUF262 domain-containing protein [Rufibacter quisquiliarum]|uniref:Uncharacterized protein with ParB-like and HNH nuclease domain n=1 Tax=Rufibacter quisquiliarum TaxID=1549639 RepID=A0A839GFA8_9BACT|nr:DUF262 domain-containing protein [Rufibacter quisquiliarum]MBA9076233.1 uncharacterized protein with ParB-like and HNH nuclease domain [Rufibacter quisquiliarum]